MSDDHNTQKDGLDLALGERLRAVRPSLSLPEPASDEPSDDELLRYIDGLMSPKERQAFEVLLADHPSAAERVAVVASALHEAGYASAAPASTEPAARLASRFVFRLSGGVLTFLRGTDLPRALIPALTVRSSPPTMPTSFFEFVQRYPFDGGDIEAKLALEPVQRQTLDVQLDVSQGGAALEGVRIKLLRDGRPIDSAPTDHGRCTFSALSVGRYELEIRKGGTEVGRMVLDVYGDCDA
jgi:hypothetical protein